MDESERAFSSAVLLSASRSPAAHLRGGAALVFADGLLELPRVSPNLAEPRGLNAEKRSAGTTLRQSVKTGQIHPTERPLGHTLRRAEHICEPIRVPDRTRCVPAGDLQELLLAQLQRLPRLVELRRELRALRPGPRERRRSAAQAARIIDMLDKIVTVILSWNA